MRKALFVLLVAAGVAGIVGWEGAFGQVEGPRVLSEKEMVDVRFSLCCWANWTTEGKLRKCVDLYGCENTIPCSLTSCKRTTTPNNTWRSMVYTGDPDDGAEEIGGTYCDVVVDGTCIMDEFQECICTGGSTEVKYYFFNHQTCTP